MTYPIKQLLHHRLSITYTSSLMILLPKIFFRVRLSAIIIAHCCIRCYELNKKKSISQKNIYLDLLKYIVYMEFVSHQTLNIILLRQIKNLGSLVDQFLPVTIMLVGIWSVGRKMSSFCHRNNARIVSIADYNFHHDT